MDEPYQAIYFIGIRLPLELDRQISRLQWQLRGLDKAVLKPLMPHVTLLNPPSLSGIMPSELLPQVRKVAERYVPFTVALQDIGFFGGRVCYVSARSHTLESLQSRLVALLPSTARELHYKRPYLPHVTLAQIYDPKVLDKQKIVEIISAALSLPRQFSVESVSYFQRILPRVYKAEDI